MNYLLYLEDTEAIPAVKILLDSDTAPIGFTDSTDICNIHKYSKKPTRKKKNILQNFPVKKKKLFFPFQKNDLQNICKFL